MKTIVTVLTDGFADWETSLLSAVARSYYGVETRFATPGARPVISMGGMTVVPGHALEELDVSAIDALVVSGGTIWRTPDAPDIGALLDRARKAGTTLALICDATLAAAKAGILDDVAHTSNGPGYLDETGYAGGALYRDVPCAVADRRVVTAGSTAPVSFMVEVLRQLGLADDNLAFYAGLHAGQFRQAA